MSVELKSVIEFDTSTGPKKIQLFYGDITALPATEKADILMISAFHGKTILSHYNCFGEMILLLIDFQW